MLAFFQDGGDPHALVTLFGRIGGFGTDSGNQLVVDVDLCTLLTAVHLCAYADLDAIKGIGQRSVTPVIVVVADIGFRPIVGVAAFPECPGTLFFYSRILAVHLHPWRFGHIAEVIHAEFACGDQTDGMFAFVQKVGTPHLIISILSALCSGIAIDVVNLFSVQIDVRPNLAAVNLTAHNNLYPVKSQRDRCPFPIVTVADKGFCGLIGGAVRPHAPGAFLDHRSILSVDLD